MPLVLGRGGFWDISVALEPEEHALYAKVKAAGAAGYTLEAPELLAAYSLYHRNVIRELGGTGKPWTYVLGRGWI